MGHGPVGDILDHSQSSAVLKSIDYTGIATSSVWGALQDQVTHRITYKVGGPGLMDKNIEYLLSEAPKGV